MSITDKRKRGNRPPKIKNPEDAIKYVKQERVLDERAKNAQIELAKRELARRKLIPFVKYRFPGYKENWHHQVLAEALERVENGEIKRLIVNMAPRHGKSELVSVNFPAWCMGRNKDRSVMAASYGASLAQDFGRKVRNIMEDVEYKAVFDTRLADDSQSKGSWATNGRGEYNAVGVGGSLTGKGCITGDAIITTDIGDIRLDTLYQLWYNGYTDIKVLGFNHKTNKVGYYGITAARQIFNREVQTLQTVGGKTVTATPDHRFYTLEQGYTPLEEVTTGNSVTTIELRDELCVLPKDIQKEIIRNKKSVQTKRNGILLFKRMFTKTPFNKKQKEVCSLSKSSPEENPEVLFQGLQKECFKKTKTNKLFRVFNSISTKISFDKVLFNILQKFKSFKKSKEYKQSKLQTWNVFGSLSKRLQAEEIFNSKRRKQEMYRVFSEDEVSCSPQGPKSNEQRRLESSISLPELPYYTSQVKSDSVSNIVTSNIKQTVYDLQIEEVENFFVNGVLVHNCGILIIDDPVKSREEADSEVISEKIWEWYKGTALTRLTPDGAVVIVMTRWRDNDLTGRILEEQKQFGLNDWTVITLQAIAEKDEEFRKQGEALWGNHYTLEGLEETKLAIGSYEFSAQYQQNPISRETQLFKPELFNYITWEDVKNKPTACYITIDSALSKKKNSDNTGVAINWVDSENIWNVKAYKIKLDPNELINHIFELNKAYSPVAIGLEETIMTQAIDPFLSVEMLKRNQHPPMVALKHGGTNKNTRIEGLYPRYERGHIRHIYGQCNDLENELVRFPASAHDDVSDAFAYQVQIAKQMDNSFDWDDFTAQELSSSEKIYSDIGL